MRLLDIKKHKRFNEPLPYTYWIECKITGLKYHGVRFANIHKNKSPLDDLGIEYFTCGLLSNEFRQNPDNFKIHLRWTFDSSKDALEYETRVNRKLLLRDDWANRGAGMNIIVTDEGRRKISEVSANMWKCPKRREFQSKMMKDYWTDKDWSEMIKEKQRTRWRRYGHLYKHKKGKDNSNAKTISVEHDNGETEIITGELVKWLRRFGLNYATFRYNLNTDKNVVLKNVYGRPVKQYPFKIFSKDIERRIQRFNEVRRIEFDDGRILELNPYDFSNWLIVNGMDVLTPYILRKNYNTGNNVVTSFIKNSKVSETLNFKIYKYNAAGVNCE